MLLYPFVFAVLPILNILAQSPGGSSLADSGVIMGTLLAGCLVIYAVAAAATGGRWSSPVIPMIVFAGVLWFYGWDLLPEWAQRLARGAPAPVTLGLGVVGAVATVGGVRWLARRPRSLDQVATFLTLTALLLVAWSGGQIVAGEIRARRALSRSAVAKELTRPLATSPAARPTGEQSRRDIYLIILDEYANSMVLHDIFGFDNHEFEDSLRQLGFTIPRSVRSNYVHTLLSLPSLLNFSHLTRLAEELGPRETDPTLPDYLVENNRTAAFLKTRGYQFLFFPSQWWISTAHNRNADWEFAPWEGLNLGREATRSDLRRSFIRTTLLDFLTRDYAWDADHVRRTLAGLEQVPALPAPTFAFAHIINPHNPYVFAADCRTARARGRGPSPRRQAYIDQLECLNGMVLRVVTTLLQRSPMPPIILLQGDHGTNFLGYSSAKSASTVSPAQARERFGAFGAYYLPAGGGRLFADSVTLVNVFPKVLNHYFGAGIPPAPDELYLSLERTPYNFVQIDPATLKPRGQHNVQTRAGTVGRPLSCGSGFSGVGRRRDAPWERDYLRT
jgi:hypothetical protein